MKKRVLEVMAKGSEIAKYPRMKHLLCTELEEDFSSDAMTLHCDLRMTDEERDKFFTWCDKKDIPVTERIL